MLKNRRISESIAELVGETPLLRLGRVTDDIQASVLVKLEFMNPSGSIKDRMALRIVEDAEEIGALRPGGTIVESSSGNTGIALSFAGAVRGYKVKIYYPESVWPADKKRMVERFGGKVEIVPLTETQIARNAGVHGAKVEVPGRIRCMEEERNNPDVFWARQFSNPANWIAQSQVGEEILEQTDGKVDVFVAAIGTGGTLLGIAQVLKKHVPNIKVVAVQPAGWPGWIDPLSPEAKYIPGITGGIVEQIRQSGVADQVVFVGNDEARDMAYQLSRREGLFCGISSGANVFVALNEARKLGAGANVVTIAVDRGDRYFTDERFIT